MPRQRSGATRQRFPGFSQRLIFDTYRGKLRVRSWPRKTKNPPTQAQRDQRDWFRSANRIARDAAPSQQRIAIEATRNTGLYPRDLILKAMSTGLLDLRLPDGRVITQRRPFVEPVMFQGATIRPTSPITIGNASLVAVPWPLPAIDTAAFWNVASPTRLTIPAGVEVVSLEAGLQPLTGGSGRLAAVIRKNGAVEVARSETQTSILQSTTMSTGAVPVVAGDYFEVYARLDVGTDLDAPAGTYFNLNLLQGA